MGLCKLSFSLFRVLCLVIVARVAFAQDSPEDYVNAHNAARAEVGVPNLVWDDTVAAFAQNYVDKLKVTCDLVHSGGDGGRYGENLAMGSGELSGTDAVKMWVDEKADYDHNSDSREGWEKSGHYTQVVWKSSESIGCAKARCDNGGTIISCNYAPPGNYFGEKPY